MALDERLINQINRKVCKHHTLEKGAHIGGAAVIATAGADAGLMLV